MNNVDNINEQGINELTGLYFTHTFFKEVEEFLKTADDGNYCMMAVDIEHFRLYNKIHGRADGDILLKRLAEIMKEFRKRQGGVVGYLGGDNFGICTVYDAEALDRLRKEIRSEIRNRNNTVGYLPAFGIYRIKGEETSAATMYDHATVALSQVIGNYMVRSCEYYPDMDEKIEEELRMLSDIQRGIDEDEFTFFIQPQCDITKGKIVGGESLVRWIHKEKGMVPPGLFIPVLEKNGFVADLDKIVWEKVCIWLRDCIDRGYQPVPISINVSRIDIFSMNVPAFLISLIEKYDLDTELLKVEITEGAYAECGDKIINTVKALQDYGFLVMMDDFGSGYSSLNMLKSVPVDVLKMDMRFLEINENEEEKGIGILESVVNMARQMKVPIVVEGVEFKQHETLLLRMGCRYTQGYYYYKPMSIKDFEVLIADRRNVDYEGFWCRQGESLKMRELLDANLINDATINNILGPVAFYDICENNIEITRVNEQYLQLAGVVADEEEEHRKHFWDHVRGDDRQLLFSIFNEAYENQSGGASGFIHYLRPDGQTLWVQIRVFFLREKNGHKIFYGALSDMTALKNKKKSEIMKNPEFMEFSEEQRKNIEEYYGTLPCGFAIGKVVVDDNGAPTDYEIVYANKSLRRISGGEGYRLRYMMQKLFADKVEELLEQAYRAAYLGEKVDCHTYSNLSGRYLNLVMSQFQHGYVSCIVQDVTHSQVYATSLNSIMSTFREVYFLHMQDNYCRMVYPDENHLLDSGNYEEIINRHFGTGKIRPYDEARVRRELSIDNLKKKLATEDSVEVQYKRQIEPAGEEWCLTTFMVSERVDGVPKTVTITIRSIEALMREKEDTKRKNMAELLPQLSEGFFVYRAVEGEKLLFANPALVKLFGCDTLEEFRRHVGGSFRGIVHPDDLKRVEWEIKEQIDSSEKSLDFICYRIITKDGRIRWIDDCGHLETLDSGVDSKLFYVFVTDVTDKMSEARKQELIELSDKFNNE